MKNLILIVISIAMTFSQVTIDQLGFRGSGGASDQVLSPNETFTVRFNVVSGSPSGAPNYIRLYYFDTNDENTLGNTNVQASASSMSNVSGNLWEFTATAPSSFPVGTENIVLRIRVASSGTYYTSYDPLGEISGTEINSSPTDFYVNMQPPAPLTVTGIGMREAASDFHFLADGTETANVSFSYTGVDPTTINALRVYWYSNATPTGGSYISNTTILSFSGFTASSGSGSFNFTLPSKASGALSFQIYAFFNESPNNDNVMSYLDETHGGTYGTAGSSGAGNAPSGYQSYNTIAADLTVTGIGIREALNDNLFDADGNDIVTVSFTYTGTDPSSVSSLDVYWYSNSTNPSSGTYLARSTGLSVSGFTASSGSGSFTFTLPDKSLVTGASSSRSIQVRAYFNNSPDNQNVMSYLDETNGGTYNTAGVSGTGNAPSNYNAFSLIKQDLIVTGIGFRKSSTSGQGFLGANNDTVSAIITNASTSRVPSGISASNIKIYWYTTTSPSGSPESSQSISTIITAMSNVNDSVTTISFRLPAKPSSNSKSFQLYMSFNNSPNSDNVMSYLDDGTDFTAGSSGAGNPSSGYFAYGTIDGSQAPSNPTVNSFRYGQPGDGIIILDFTAGSDPDGSVSDHIAVIKQGSFPSSETDGTVVSLGASSLTTAQISSVGNNSYIRLYTKDNTNVYSSGVNMVAPIDQQEGYTITLATGSLSFVQNVSPSTTNNELLAFSFTPSEDGTQTTSETATISSITITITGGGGISNTHATNFRLYEDTDGDGQLDGGETTQVGSAQNYGSTITFSSLSFVLTSSAKNLLLVFDATSSANGTHTIRASITSSSEFTIQNNVNASRAGSANNPSDITLPVTLVDGSFKARRVKEGFFLSAETASEDNVKYIIYQRSTSEKNLDELTDEDWHDTGLFLESGPEYTSQGRKLPELLDKIDIKSIKKLRYRIITEELDGSRQHKYDLRKNILSIEDNVLLATEFKLKNNYPNPFNPKTNIIFDLPYESTVTVLVYNILGQKVKTLANKKLVSAGQNQQLEWDATNDFGGKVSSGIYFYQIIINNNEFIANKKMILLK